MTINYKNFDKKFIEEKHGRLYYYRDLYEGKHAKIFKRAQKLIEEGEIVANILENQREVRFAQTPYIVANITKLIVDVPAILVSRSIGKITSSLDADAEQIAASNEATDDEIEGPDQQNANGTILDLQNEMIRQIVLNSKLEGEHWGNIVQQQLDGGLVGVPWDDARGLRIEFKARDVYFPHEDDLGADLSYSRTFDDMNYLHVYRERIMKDGDTAEGPGGEDYTAAQDGLYCTHRLFLLGSGGIVEESEVDPVEAADMLNMPEEDLAQWYEGRQRTFIRYWANEKTFMNPLGVSVLKGQEDKQDEINWTLTRNAAVFERNGKPRLAINKDLATALQKEMVRLYGQEAKGKFDHRQLEVVSMDAAGKSMEIIQIDISKIGDVQWVKDLIKLMLTETKTSEKAIDFYMDQGGGAAQSGVAKFYDLFISLMKAEMLQKEYIHFLKGLVEDALWLANQNDPAVRIEQPEVIIDEMFPVQRKEVIEENLLAFKDGAQSRETTVTKINPHNSEEWVEEELARIAAEKASDNSSTLGLPGRQTIGNLLDNPLNRARVTPPAATPGTDPAAE